MSAQPSFLSLAHHKKLRCEKFLDEMETVIPWRKFLEVIAPHYPQNIVGRQAKELLMMLKIYFLQQWFNLSDPGAEEAICDRISFQKFLGIDVLADTVPDETTILNFRHVLEAHKLQERFLDIANAILTEKGYFMRKGTIVDATLIAAPSSTKNKEKKRDPEMSQAKKGNQWYFGMKGHIGVDADSGLVHSVETTTAKTRRKTSKRLGRPAFSTPWLTVRKSIIRCHRLNGKRIASILPSGQRSSIHSMSSRISGTSGKYGTGDLPRMVCNSTRSSLSAISTSCVNDCWRRVHHAQTERKSQGKTRKHDRNHRKTCQKPSQAADGFLIRGSLGLWPRPGTCLPAGRRPLS